MATVIIDCKDNALRGVRDPYSNEVLEFKLALGGGAPRIFSSNAVSPTTPRETSQEAYILAHTRAGVQGALGDHEAVRCPYTGKPMMLVGSEGAYRWLGGFDPTTPTTDIPAYINLVRTRDGVLQGEERSAAPFTQVVEQGSDVVPSDVDVSGLSLTKDTEDTVRAIVDGPAPKKTVVAVNGRKKKKQ